MLMWEVIKKYQEKEFKKGTCLECLSVPPNDDLRILYIKDTYNGKKHRFALVKNILDKNSTGLCVDWAIVHNYKFKVVD